MCDKENPNKNLILISFNFHYDSQINLLPSQF